MSTWQVAGAADMLQDGSMAEVVVGRQSVLLARIGGQYYAAQARCPHLRGRLAKGILEGKVVTCPLHGSRFDLTTGGNVAWVEGLHGLIKGMAQAISKPSDLATFETRVQGAQVWVRI